MHTFEEEPAEFTDFSATGRVTFEEIESQNVKIQSDPAVLALLNNNPLPVLVFGEHLQLLFANPAAQKIAEEADLRQILGLRLGEFLGIEHKMHGHKCGEPGGCANCNELPVVQAALRGESAEQTGELTMNPEDPQKKTTYKLLAAPLPFQGKNLALLYFIEV